MKHPSHLQSALQSSERERLLVDDGILVAPDERLPEVVLREGLLVADQRDAPFLYVV